MPDNSDLRASDRDRDAHADLLREAHADGRLSVDEFQERIDALYDATTIGQIGQLVRDISAPPAPAGIAPQSSPVAASDPNPASQGCKRCRVLKVLWVLWTCILCVDLIIWGAVSIAGSRVSIFWPVWLAIPGVALLVAQRIHRQHRPDAT